MHRLVIGCSLALLLCGTLASASGQEKSWPWFRGVDRSAVSKETGLLQEWPADGPPIVLETKGAGRGYASIIVAGGRFFTLGDTLSTADDKDEYLSCFDQKTGEQLWKTKTGPAWEGGPESWQSSRSTPSYDGDRIYCLTPYGKLHCCKTDGGEIVWTKDLKKDFGGDKGDGWGYSESVLLDGDRLICTPGKSENTMLALDKLTGEKIWGCSREADKGAGHASIVITDVGGEKVYVNTTASGGLGVRAKDGKLAWSYDAPQATAVIPTPIVRGDLVFLTAGYSSGGTLLKQSLAADGGISLQEVYPLNKDLKNKHGGIVLVGDFLYGDSDDKGIPYCADLMTGEIKWKKRGSGKDSAAMMAADGRLYILFADGTLVLAKADPTEYTEVGSVKVGEAKRPFWAHPVLVDGKLYIRDQDRIVVYDVKAK
jgi:outer membrane protein assembly factor BamB